MKAIIVCVAPTYEKLKETIIFLKDDYVVKSKNEYIYEIDMESVSYARVFMAYDLVNPHISNFSFMDKIVENRVNEFNVNSVNISIRVGDEKNSFLKYYNSLKD